MPFEAMLAIRLLVVNHVTAPGDVRCPSSSRTDTVSCTLRPPASVTLCGAISRSLRLAEDVVSVGDVLHATSAVSTRPAIIGTM